MSAIEVLTIDNSLIGLHYLLGGRKVQDELVVLPSNHLQLAQVMR